MSETRVPRNSPRERLLAAADDLFYGQGINATGVEAVLRTADVARNTLYHHFGGKDGLGAAYLNRRDARWRADWERAIGGREQPIDRLLAVFDALQSWWERGDSYRGCAFVDAAVEVTDPDHPVRVAVSEHKAHLYGRLAELAAEAGMPDPDEVAADLVLLHEGALTGLLLGLQSDPIDRARALARARCDPGEQPS